jgi:tetratricopeptide (TPR) repeat protein
MQRSCAQVGMVSLAALAMLAPFANLGAREPEQPVAGQKPPWQRLLQGEDAKKAKELEDQIAKLTEAGRFDEALKAAEEVAGLRGKVQGADQWQAVNARWRAEALHRALRAGKEDHADFATASRLNQRGEEFLAKGKYEEAHSLFERALAIRRKVLGEEHPDTAESYASVAHTLNAQGKSARAEPLFQKALDIYRKALGEDHPSTAESYDNLAVSLNAQGKYAEAEPLLQKALDTRCKVLGEEHIDTAASFNNTAYNLNGQGKYARAEPLYQKALDICRKTLGDDDPHTAISFANLAANLMAQGKYAQAEPLYQKALDIRRKTLGEGHHHTGRSYNNLAANLDKQGKYAQAEPLLQKTLDIYRKALGEEHPETATSYDNVAYNLDKQGKYAQAEPLLQKALDIRRKAFGEEHPYTATSYDYVGYNLDKQCKYAQAEPLLQKALDIRRRAPGEEHPDTARSYARFAANLRARGKYAQAEPLYQQALDIYRKVLGEEHPSTAQTYNNLAANLNARGMYAEAESFWTLGSDRFVLARLRLAGTGLDRATVTSEDSPLPSLAAVLARNGELADAWRRFEESLARGTWDDLSARLRRPAAEQARQAAIVARLDRLDQLVEKATTRGEPSPEQKKRHDDLLTQRRKAQDELDDLARELEAKDPANGQVFALNDVAAALPPDAALVGWLDLPGYPKAADPNGEHWAFVLRTRGEPAVIRLHGTGPGDHWADADAQLPADLRVALQSPRGDWQPLAERLRKQRLDPLAEQLGSRDGLPVVRRLIVLPSTALAGVPAEVFADRYTVSYALSGTLYAYLHQQLKLETTGLLALADPVFERPAVPELPIPTAPPGGLLLTSVVAGGNAAQSGLKAGDVLLRYNGTTLASRTDLKTLPESDDAAKRVPVTVWREGKTLDKELRPGKLGAVLASAPAPQALAAKYEADRWLARSRGGDDGRWDPLPGTRIEAEGLRKLLAGTTPEPLVLADSEASEQRLYDLAKSGELGKYRYLHLATHGTVDDRFPLRSAIILSRDALPDPDKQLDAGLPVFDGRLTAEEVLRQWHLNADLVTLSACQTALGKYESCEGYVGFAQALILAGSRSVCLSLWKVDDTATALLMNRFYENLLGKRDGLKGPMGKADALAEAKSWLRGLSRDEAAQRAAKMSDGVARGKRPKLPPVLPAEAKEAETREKASTDRDRPYAHPYYWAAFVLIGDPD